MSSIPLQQLHIYPNIFENNNLDPLEYTLMTYLLGSPTKNYDENLNNDYMLPIYVYAKHQSDSSKNKFITYDLNWHDLSHARIGYKINANGTTEPYPFKQNKQYNISAQEIEIEKPLTNYEMKTLEEISTQYQIFSKISKHLISVATNVRFCVFKLKNDKNLIISSHEIINFFYTNSKYNLLKTAVLSLEGLNRVVEDGKLKLTTEGKWLMTLTHTSKLADKNQILYFLLHPELAQLFNDIGSTFNQTGKLSAPIPVLNDVTIMAKVFEVGNEIFVLKILNGTHLKDCFSKFNPDDYLATHKDKLEREHKPTTSNKKHDEDAVNHDNTLGTNTSASKSKSDDEIILEDDDFSNISYDNEKYAVDFKVKEIYYGKAEVSGATPHSKQVDGNLTTKKTKGGKKPGKFLTNASPDDNNKHESSKTEFDYSELIDKLKSDNYVCDIYSRSFEILHPFFKTKRGKLSKRIELFKDYQAEIYREFKIIHIQKDENAIFFCDIEARLTRTQEDVKYTRNSILLVKSDLEVREFLKKYFTPALIGFVKTQQFLSSMNIIMETFSTKIIKHISNMDTIKRNIDDFMGNTEESNYERR
jgi:hypothetical protein